MSNDKVDITGLSKAEVLAALFNATSPAGMGFLQAGNGPDVMTIEQAQQLIDGGHTATPDYGGIDLPGKRKLYFDYLYGRPLKLDLTDNDSFSPWGFDRDNGGTGTAQKVIDRLRATGNVNPPESTATSQSLYAERAERNPFEALLGKALTRTRKTMDALDADGIPEPPQDLTARQYLNWASDQTLKYYDSGNPDKATMLFLELVSRDERTAYIATSPLTNLLLHEGIQEGRDRLEYMMKGFAV